MPTYPQHIVEIAFASNPTDATQTWTDVSQYVQAFSTRRGRSTELDQFQAGTASVTLKNQDRRFDPDYPASPYAPGVKIGKRLRISATWNGTTYRLFEGYIEAWPQTWENFVAAHVQVTASDAFKRFSLYSLNGDYSGNINGDGPWGYWQFSGNLNDSSSHGNNGTWSGSNPASYGGMPFAGGTSGLSSKYFGSDDVMTHGTAGFAAGGFSIETWLHNTGWTGTDANIHGIWQSLGAGSYGTPNYIGLFKHPAGNALFFVVVTPSGTMQSISYSVSSWVASTWHYLAATADTTNGLCLYIDSVKVTQGYQGTAVLPTVAPSAPRWGLGADTALLGFLAQSALYSVALRADQVADRWKSYRCYFPAQDAPTRLGAALDVLGWPTADRDFDGGVATLAMGNPDESLLSYGQRINASEVGRTFMAGDGKVRFIGRDATFSPPYTVSQCTFGDNIANGELPYTDLTLSYDDTRVWNEVRLQRENGYVQVVRDTAIQASDIVRTFPSSTALLHSTDAQTLAAAQFRLNQYKQAVLRVDGLTLQPARLPDATWPWALGLEIGDRVTVVRRPQNVGTMSQQCYIEGIEHQADARSVSWQTRYTLSLADVQTFWLLGDATRSILGSTTYLSF